MTPKDILNDAKAMAEHNRFCYSATYLCNAPKPGYEEQWEKETEKLRVIEQMIAREPEPLPDNFSVKVPNHAVLLLIKDENLAKTDAGKYTQKCYAAFVDGYETAVGELSRFITDLYRNKDENSYAVHSALNPLRKKQDESFSKMCDFLNNGDFDTVE